MVSPRLVIALVAGMTATTTAAVSAQPIVSPHETDPMPAEAPPPKAEPAKAEPAKAEPAKAEPAKAESAKTEPAKSEPTKATAATKHKSKARSHSAKSTSRSAKSTSKPASKTVAKAKHPAKSKSKSKSKSKPKAAQPATKASARAATIPMRSARADNLPRGFSWPATPAMQAAGKACEAELDSLGVTWKPAPSQGKMVDAIEIPDGKLGGVTYTSMWQAGPPRLDCQLARALAQVGKDLHALGVREVKWGSIYRWSNVRTQGRTLPFLSRHALGLAMDIVEFVDDAGHVANVQRDYPAANPLLTSVEQLINTSGRFRILLTPKNDPKSHHDHFHLEANPDYAGAPPSPVAPSNSDSANSDSADSDSANSDAASSDSADSDSANSAPR